MLSVTQGLAGCVVCRLCLCPVNGGQGYTQMALYLGEYRASWMAVVHESLWDRWPWDWIWKEGVAGEGQAA